MKFATKKKAAAKKKPCEEKGCSEEKEVVSALDIVRVLKQSAPGNRGRFCFYAVSFRIRLTAA